MSRYKGGITVSSLCGAVVLSILMAIIDPFGADSFVSNIVIVGLPVTLAVLAGIAVGFDHVYRPVREFVELMITVTLAYVMIVSTVSLVVTAPDETVSNMLRLNSLHLPLLWLSAVATPLTFLANALGCYWYARKSYRLLMLERLSDCV